METVNSRDAAVNMGAEPFERFKSSDSGRLLGGLSHIADLNIPVGNDTDPRT